MYYIDIKNQLEKLMISKEYAKAIEIINEELSMPYIPMEFETFLIETLDQIPMGETNEAFSLSLEKIVDLLVKLDESNNDLAELINQLRKFNLKEEKDELEFYFSKSKNKRNRAMIFELLINEKADIECELGSTLTSKSITELENYKEDLTNLKESLGDYPTLEEPANKLLNEIYLTHHYGQELKENYHDVVMFTLARIFEQEELIELIKNYEKLKETLESFKNFQEL